MSFPAERSEGKGNHPRRVCGANEFLGAPVYPRARDARPGARLIDPLPSLCFATFAGDDTLNRKTLRIIVREPICSLRNS